MSGTEQDPYIAMALLELNHAGDPFICSICLAKPSIAPGLMCLSCTASWNRHIDQDADHD